MRELRINLVAAFDGHILFQTAAEVARRTGWSLREQADPQADANIYFPYYLMGAKTKWDVAIFTHRESDPKLKAKTDKFDEAAITCDVPIAMSFATWLSMPCVETRILEIPAHPRFCKERIKVLVPTLNYGPGSRKCHEILERLDAPGIDLIWTGGAATHEEMVMWYNECDYVLVVGNKEGGPMAVKEAIAMGKPVIAPDVGWCWSHPVIEYDGESELNQVLRELAPKPNAWKEYTDGLLAACEGARNGIYG